MTYLALETFFANSSFLFLFCSMMAYWIQTSFRIQKPNIALILCGLANISLFILLTLRWKESGHFPLSNLYESLMFLSWNLTAIQLFLATRVRMADSLLLGTLTSPMALLTNTFATFSLPLDMKTSSSLVPALQSNWLVMHVTVMILSYSALIFGSLLAMAFLILTWQSDPDIVNTELNSLAGSTPVYPESGESSTLLLEYSETVDSKNLERSKFLGKTTFELSRMIDNLSYRILGIGFPLLTIGILSGAVWANEAWGSYWSWDPKETWALLTWLVFAIYLHTRLNKGWEGKKPAIIASVGFFVVWMCFLGVNLLGEGLHSYGWIS